MLKCCIWQKFSHINESKMPAWKFMLQMQRKANFFMGASVQQMQLFQRLGDPNDHFSTGSFLLVDCVRTKETASLDFVFVNDQLRISFGFLQQYLLRHHKELVKIHLLLLSQIFLDLFLRLGLLSSRFKFVQVDKPILRLVGIEGILDLDDLILIQPLVEVLLHLEVTRQGGVALRLCVSHLNLQKIINISISY